MKKTVIATAIIATLLCAVSAVLYLIYKNDVLETIAISAGTTAYHFVMRLLIGTIVNAALNNRVDYTRGWFAPKAFEQKLYKLLNVKKWKANMPTYSPETFSVENHTLEEIVGATCQAELVHEIIIVLSFLPIATIPWFGVPLVFILTSVFAALFDLIFVIMQRFNRPRLVKLLERQKRSAKE